MFDSAKLLDAVSSFPLGFEYVANFSFFSSGCDFSVIKSEWRVASSKVPSRGKDVFALMGDDGLAALVYSPIFLLGTVVVLASSSGGLSYSSLVVANSLPRGSDVTFHIIVSSVFFIRGSSRVVQCAFPSAFMFLSTVAIYGQRASFLISRWGCVLGATFSLFPDVSFMAT